MITRARWANFASLTTKTVLLGLLFSFIILSFSEKGLSKPRSPEEHGYQIGNRGFVQINNQWLRVFVAQVNGAKLIVADTNNVAKEIPASAFVPAVLRRGFIEAGDIVRFSGSQERRRIKYLGSNGLVEFVGSPILELIDGYEFVKRPAAAKPVVSKAGHEAFTRCMAGLLNEVLPEPEEDMADNGVEL